MDFDPQIFLTEYAEAYNSRDSEELRGFFALEDSRFAVFEDYSGRLFDGETYRVVLESVFDATSEMKFELLRSDRFDGFAVVHAIQKLTVKDEEEGIGEASIRATLLVDLAGGTARIVTAHFSLVPQLDAECSPSCGCRG